MTNSAPPTLSVVIPAHDEGAVISRCLGFLADLAPGEAEVVVVANGCTDDTARIAGQVPGVRVVDLPAPGKSGALNAGDDVATAFPRIYLDADITVDAATLRRVRDALSGPAPRIAAPPPEFVLSGRPLLVRMFYAAFTRLPYVRDNLVGLGLYGISRAGRDRFGPFPRITADDLFVQRLFSPEERLLVAAAPFRIETPRTVRSVVAVRTRAAFGNAELAATGGDHTERSTGATVGALVAAARREPRMIPSFAVYAVLTVAGRLGARRRSAGAWHRDSTTRTRDAPAGARRES